LTKHHHSTLKPIQGRGGHMKRVGWGKKVQGRSNAKTGKRKPIHFQNGPSTESGGPFAPKNKTRGKCEEPSKYCTSFAGKGNRLHGGTCAERGRAPQKKRKKRGTGEDRLKHGQRLWTRNPNPPLWLRDPGGRWEKMGQKERPKGEECRYKKLGFAEWKKRDLQKDTNKVAFSGIESPNNAIRNFGCAGRRGEGNQIHHSTSFHPAGGVCVQKIELDHRVLNEG